MSTKAGGTDHLFLFTYANHLLWDMVFVLIFSIYLFIYSKRCQQKQVELTTCLYLLMEIYCWFIVVFILIFIIYLFIYSKRCEQKHLEVTTCFYLLMQMGCWLHMVFVLIFIIYLFIYSKQCQPKAGGSDLYYRPQQSWSKVMFLHVSVNISTISGGRRNTYGWQAAGTHPTGMLSCLLIQIGCCDLFLEIHL